MIAIAPGAFAFLLEGLVLIASLQTGSNTPPWIGVSFFGLGIGLYFWLVAAYTICGRLCWR